MKWRSSLVILTAVILSWGADANAEGLQVTQKMNSSLKMAFSKAVDPPKDYQVRKVISYRFEQRVRYRVELGGGDGSIWRALIDEDEAAKRFEVASLSKVEPTAIFKPFASATRKREAWAEKVE